MKSVTQCLQVSDIEALLAGDAATGQSELWEEHVSSCESCRVAMAGRIGDQQWWREAEQSLQHVDLAEGRKPSGAPPDGSRPSTHDCELSSDATDEHETTDELLKLLGPTDDPRMLGRLGTYEVLGVLGRGGMGIVFKAFDAPLNRYVAIKMLLPHLAASGAARKRFEREGQAAAAVIDDHVLPIYAVSKWQNIPYLVMQYSSGNNLQRRIDVDGPLDVKEILRIGMQTARGLAAAHAQGLVHRDVKPSNMLLDGTVERVLLTDFGLARAVDDASVTRTGTIAGTPQYMSPEQASGKSVDARSDLFGLGCVLYAMCTGHPPFRAESSYAILRLITDEEPRPIREINADIPGWLCSIISKLMSKKADERYRDAKEVAELLEQCLAHVQQPTATPLPESLVARAPQRNRRPPIGRFIAAAAFAFSLIFAGVLIVLELNKGTLKIECEADDVPIRVIQGANVVQSLTVNKSGKIIRVAAGQYVIEVDGSLNGINIQDGSVSLARGSTEVVRITVEESTESPDRDVHDTDVKGTREDHQYLVWEDDGRVRLSHWFAKAVRVDDETLNSINQLLSETWAKYMKLEDEHTTYSPSSGRLTAEISEFSDERQRLESNFWKRLDEIVSGEQRTRLHAISTARGDANGDDTWPYRPKAFPSVIGWHEKRFPVRVELWTKGTWFYWRVSEGKYTSSGDGQQLPAELRHFWTLGNHKLDGQSLNHPAPISDVVINATEMPAETILWNVAGALFAPILEDELPASPWKSGLRVTHLRENGPAEDAMLRVGDIVVEIDSQPIESIESISLAWRRTDFGAPVSVQLLRDGQPVVARLKWNTRAMQGDALAKGKVLIRYENTVVVSLGTDDGVYPGDRLEAETLYMLGSLEVVTVSADQSVTRIVSEHEGLPVKVGDSVIYGRTKWLAPPSTRDETNNAAPVDDPPPGAQASRDAAVGSSRPFSRFIRRTAFDNQARIHGELAANQQLVLQIEESKHNKALSWTTETKAGPFTVILTRTSVPTGPGTIAPGFTYQIVHDETGGGGTTNVACSATGPLPNATIHFEMVKPEERELRGPSPINTLWIATLKYPDGTEAPVTLKIRAADKQIATVRVNHEETTVDAAPALDNEAFLLRARQKSESPTPLVTESTVPADVPTIDYGGICVRAEDEIPIAGAVARFFLLNVHGKRSSLSLLETTTTDKDGHFRFDSRIPDEAEVDLARSRIAITSTGRASRVLFWQGGADPRQIEMRPSAALKGRVTDSASRPVAGANVRLGPSRMPGVNDAVSDKDGRFEIADLEKVDKFSYEDGISNILYVEHPDGSKSSAIVQSIPSTVDIMLTSTVGTAGQRDGVGKTKPSVQSNSTSLVNENNIVWSNVTQGLRLGVSFADSERGKAQQFTPGDVGHLQIYLQNASDEAIRAGFEPTDACKAVFQISSQDGRVIAHNGSEDSEQHVVPAPLSANFRELNSGEIRLLNDDFAGTATRSPAHKLRLDDIASFTIVDNDHSSKSLPRRYRLTPGKYVVSVTLEVYSGQDRFPLTSGGLPFEVVEAEARDQLNSQATPLGDDPFSIDGAKVSRGKQVSGVLSAHDAISRYMKAVDGIRSFDVTVHEEKAFLYKQVPIDEPEIQGRRTRLVDYAKGESRRIEHRYSRQVWEANGRQRVELLHGDPATGSGIRHVSTYDGERVRLLEVDSGHESTRDIAPAQKPLISYEGRYHSLFSELYAGGTLLELLQHRNDVTLSEADGLVRLTVSPQPGTMYPKFQFAYELDPAHGFLPRSIAVSILNRKLSQVRVTDFHRLADGRFVPLAAIHETFGIKDGEAGAVVIERTELTVDPSRSTWNEPVDAKLFEPRSSKDE